MILIVGKSEWTIVLPEKDTDFEEKLVGKLWIGKVENVRDRVKDLVIIN